MSNTSPTTYQSAYDDRIVSAITNIDFNFLEITDAEDPSLISTTTAKLKELGFLLPGEEVKKIFQNVQIGLVGSLGMTENSTNLYVTNFKIFALRGSFIRQEIEAIHSVPMGTILRIKDKKKTKTVLEIYCKDGRCLLVFFTSIKDRPIAIDTISKYAFPSTCHQLFAFVHKICIESSEDPLNNVKTSPFYFDPDRDYVRQGFYEEKTIRCTMVNMNFSICSSYPKLLFVPASITDQELREIAQFRSKGRIPSIVWMHPKHTSLLVRCAQPCVGLQRVRSLLDEKFLNELKVPGQEKLYIVDSRPKANAVANMLRGGGFENPKVYKDVEIEFSNIENIHVIRNSLQAVHKACQNASPLQLAQFELEIQESKWLLHLRLILESVVRVVQLLHTTGFSVLVHCSDGWDRTSQTTATCGLLLEPYYRKIEGFIVLIEREWLQFGHQFALRYGHGDNMGNYRESQRSPIFPQWIDLVWQLMQIYPKYFEFNENLLVYILEELYSCKTGTFLFNSVQERTNTVDVYRVTVSAWDYVIKNIDQFKNPNYLKKKGTIIPTSLRLQLWSSYYLQYKEERLKTAQIFENLEHSLNGDDQNSSQARFDDLIYGTKAYSTTTVKQNTKGNKKAKFSTMSRNTYAKRRRSGSFVLDKGQSILPKSEDGSFHAPSDAVVEERLNTLFKNSSKNDKTDENNNNTNKNIPQSEIKVPQTTENINNNKNAPRSRVTRSNSIGNIFSTVSDTALNVIKAEREKSNDITDSESKNEESDSDSEDEVNENDEENSTPIITSSIPTLTNTDRNTKTNSTICREMLGDDSMSKKDKRKARLVTPSILTNLQDEETQRLQRTLSLEQLAPVSPAVEATKKRHNSQSPIARLISPRKKS